MDTSACWPLAYPPQALHKKSNSAACWLPWQDVKPVSLWPHPVLPSSGAMPFLACWLLWEVTLQSPYLWSCQHAISLSQSSSSLVASMQRDMGRTRSRHPSQSQLQSAERLRNTSDQHAVIDLAFPPSGSFPPITPIYIQLSMALFFSALFYRGRSLVFFAPFPGSPLLRDLSSGPSSTCLWLLPVTPRGLGSWSVARETGLERGRVREREQARSVRFSGPFPLHTALCHAELMILSLGIPGYANVLCIREVRIGEATQPGHTSSLDTLDDARVDPTQETMTPSIHLGPPTHLRQVMLLTRPSFGLSKMTFMLPEPRGLVGTPVSPAYGCPNTAAGDGPADPAPIAGSIRAAYHLRRHLGNGWPFTATSSNQAARPIEAALQRSTPPAGPPLPPTPRLPPTTRAGTLPVPLGLRSQIDTPDFSLPSGPFDVPIPFQAKEAVD